MPASRKTFELRVMLDGSFVIDQEYDTDRERAEDFNTYLVETGVLDDDNTEEVDDATLAQGLEAVLDAYSNLYALTDELDVFYNEYDQPYPAPNTLFHVVTSYPGENPFIVVDSFGSQVAREHGLFLRAQATDDALSQDLSEETYVELLENRLGINITLVDADMDDDAPQWHSDAH